ncbi:phosphopantetheine adenylyltransferase [Bacteroidia bacterium]|nr:phosphopantetheine adenylyltransferase [Bacteroidia bacterium]
MNCAVFPGSFDPFTIGHQQIAMRALAVCDKLIIAIGNNDAKKAMFTPEERQQRIAQIFANEKRIETAIYKGLTIDFCQQAGAKLIVRGLRSVADCAQEILIAQANQAMNSSIETVFFLAQPAVSGISSTVVRDVIANGGNAAVFLPNNEQRQKEQRYGMESQRG